MTAIDRLAANIKADLLRERPAACLNIMDCFACGRSFVYRGPNGDDSGRFCSSRCREWHDAGNPAYDPTYASKSNPRWYSLPIAPKGFYIDCACCGERFDSKGLRCCSIECERGLGQKREVEKLKAEAGVEFVSKLGDKRKCEAPGCPHDIPRWRNGRQVSKATRFCSDKCRKRHSRLNPDLSAEAAREGP